MLNILTPVRKAIKLEDTGDNAEDELPESPIVPEQFKTDLARFAFETPVKKSSSRAPSRIHSPQKVNGVKRSQRIVEVVIRTPKKEEDDTNAIESPAGELANELTEVTLNNTVRRSPRTRSAPNLTRLANILNGEEDSTNVGRPKTLKRASTSRAGGSSPKKKRGYAPPEVYAHLNFLPDCMAMDMKGLIPPLLSLRFIVTNSYV